MYLPLLSIVIRRQRLQYYGAAQFYSTAPATLRKRTSVKIGQALIGLLLCASALTALPAHSANKTPARQELVSGSALLVDLNTNEVLYLSNPGMVVPIASVTSSKCRGAS